MRKCTFEWLSNRQLAGTDASPKYFVYHYINPFNGEIFYVGKGKRRRHKIHLTHTKRGIIPNGNNGKLFRYIKGLLDNGVEPTIEKVNEGMTEIEALALEAAYIDYYGLDNLCNYMQSGIGAVNHTPEVKAKCAWAAREQYSNKVGGWNNYFKRIYQTALQDKLKDDLRLLRSVIADIRQDLRQKRRADKDMPVKEAYKPRMPRRKRFNRLSLWANT